MRRKLLLPLIMIALIFPPAPVFAYSPVDLIIRTVTNIWRTWRGDDEKKQQGKGVIRETGESGTSGAPGRNKAIMGASRSSWEYMKETFAGPDKSETDWNDNRSPEAIRALEDFKRREREKESLNPVVRARQMEPGPANRTVARGNTVDPEKPAMVPGKE